MDEGGCLLCIAGGAAGILACNLAIDEYIGPAGIAVCEQGIGLLLGTYCTPCNSPNPEPQPPSPQPQLMCPKPAEDNYSPYYNPNNPKVCPFGVDTRGDCQSPYGPG
jgi:hypothetical protein